MKLNLCFVVLAFFVASGVFFVGCSREECTIGCEEVFGEEQGGDVVLTLSTNVSLGITSTRAVDDNGVKTFSEGDQIALVYTNTKDVTVKTSSQALEDVDISNSGQSARFTVSLINPKAGTVRYVYPASMVDENGVMTSLASQIGTLDGLQDFDYAEGSGVITDNSLPSNVNMTNRLSVGVFTLKDNSGTAALSDITSVTIYTSAGNYTIESASAINWPIYVAMNPVEDAAISFKASDATNTYWKLVSSATLEASNFYPINVKMGSPGALPGLFSVSSTKQVYFSKGNLQATTTTLGGTNGDEWTWAFAAHQYDTLGVLPENNSANKEVLSNGNGTVSANGTVDLFAWMGSHVTLGGAAKYGIYKSSNDMDAPSGSIGDERPNEWGDLIGPGWFTMTKEQWAYLLEERAQADSKVGLATVAGNHGLILLPDTFILPDGLAAFDATPSNSSDTAYDKNIYDADEWEAMEAAGAVFLPVAGTLLFQRGHYDNALGAYWTASHGTYAQNASYFCFGGTNITNYTPIKKYSIGSRYRNHGLSVRLTYDPLGE